MDLITGLSILALAVVAFLVTRKVLKKRAVKKFDKQNALRERERQTYYFYDEGKQ